MNAGPGYLVETLGLNGSAICIHSSMRSFKPRVQASSIIQAFLDNGCTVLVPTFTYFNEISPPADDCPTPLPSISPVYQQTGNDLSVRDMGYLPAVLLKMEGRKRGNHPLNSFSAVGEQKDELIAEQTWEDVYAPLRKLVELDGKLLMMGTDLTSLTFVHYAEQIVGRNLITRWARDTMGRVERARTGSCSRAFNNLQLSIDHLREDVIFRGARCQLLPARQTLDALVSAIRSHPKITQCKDRMCLRCNSANMGDPKG